MSNRRTSQGSAIVRVVRDAPGPLRPLEILDLASRIVPTLGIATGLSATQAPARRR